MPSNEQLIAHSHTTEEICEMIGADSLGYMEVEKLKDMVGDLKFVMPALQEIIRWRCREKISVWHLNRKKGEYDYEQ